MIEGLPLELRVALWGSTLLLLVILIVINRGKVLLGLTMIVLGFFSNLLAIAANDWRMPVLGLEVATDRHAPLTAETNLWFLTDVIVGVSLGDVLLLAGINFVGAYWLMKGRHDLRARLKEAIKSRPPEGGR